MKQTILAASFALILTGCGTDSTVPCVPEDIVPTIVVDDTGTVVEVPTDGLVNNPITAEPDVEQPIESIPDDTPVVDVDNNDIPFIGLPEVTGSWSYVDYWTYDESCPEIQFGCQEVPYIDMYLTVSWPDSVEGADGFTIYDNGKQIGNIVVGLNDNLNGGVYSFTVKTKLYNVSRDDRDRRPKYELLERSSWTVEAWSSSDQLYSSGITTPVHWGDGSYGVTE